MQGSQVKWQAAFTGMLKEKLENIFFKDCSLNASRFGGGIFQCQPHFSNAKDSLKTHSSPFFVGSRCQQVGERSDYTSNTDTLNKNRSVNRTCGPGILEMDNSRE